MLFTVKKSTHRALLRVFLPVHRRFTITIPRRQSRNYIFESLIPKSTLGPRATSANNVNGLLLLRIHVRLLRPYAKRSKKKTSLARCHNKGDNDFYRATSDSGKAKNRIDAFSDAQSSDGSVVRAENRRPAFGVRSGTAPA